MATSVSLASRLFPPAPPARPHITPRSFVPARLPRRLHRRGASSAGRSLRRGESLRLFRAIRPTQSRQPSVRRLRHVHADGPAALAVRPSAVVLCAAGLHGHWRAHRGERRDDRWRVLIAPRVARTPSTRCARRPSSPWTYTVQRLLHVRMGGVSHGCDTRVAGGGPHAQMCRVSAADRRATDGRG